MSNVPSELHRDILLRLPAASLFRFRVVCKAWRRMIDDPSFVKSHTNNSQRSSHTLLIRTTTGLLYSLSLDSLNYINGQQTVYVNRVKNLVRLGVPRLPGFPVASCNGLILLSHYEINKIWVIWNPLTGDFHELPQLGMEFCLMGSGLGYDFASDDYKVVRIDNVCISRKFSYRTLIYSLKLNSWKMIDDCPCDFSRVSQGLFLNGALYWNSCAMIVALDLATEKYRQIPLPAEERMPFDLRLDAMDGCLVLSDDYAILRAWMLRDYKAEEPLWVEMFSSRERSAIGGTSGCIWPLAYSKSQRQLILQHENKIIRWDIEKYSSKKVSIHGLPGCQSSQIVPGSLFRFNNSGGGGGGGSIAAKGVKRKRVKATKRLKLSVTTIESGFLSDSDYYSSEGEGDDFEC
ncbi:hypothetical protein OROMI_014326 [Orobanche minor]